MNWPALLPGWWCAPVILWGALCLSVLSALRVYRDLTREDFLLFLVFLCVPAGFAMLARVLP